MSSTISHAYSGIDEDDIAAYMCTRMPHINRSAVGARIRALRESRGLSAQDLAQALDGASTATVSRWENGHALPTKHLPGLAEFFGVSTEHILYGERQIGGPRDVKTERIRTLLAKPEWGHLTETEREGLALALRNVEADDHEINLALSVLFKRKR